MKFKIDETVKYFADDTERYYHGVIKKISENFIKPEFTQYQVSFTGGDFWLYEKDLEKTFSWWGGK